ncbi:MAG: SWIM zinc finger family protein [Methanomicrobiales archaeon]|jgi:predicted nucleic acid-binding Zn finger protein|nr:SWIM zinc finger family protein [Methanomicrobiales archaeon]
MTDRYEKHTPDPIHSLIVGEPAPPYLRNKICGHYQGRGKKAFSIIDNLQVKKYLDFFVVVGNQREYVVFDDFCTCSDFLHRGGRCGHILAMQIARVTQEFESYDLWFYETIIEEGI